MHAKPQQMPFILSHNASFSVGSFSIPISLVNLFTHIVRSVFEIFLSIIIPAIIVLVIIVDITGFHRVLIVWIAFLRFAVLFIIIAYSVQSSIGAIYELPFQLFTSSDSVGSFDGGI